MSALASTEVLLIEVMTGENSMSLAWIQFIPGARCGALPVTKQEAERLAAFKGKAMRLSLSPTDFEVK